MAKPKSYVYNGQLVSLRDISIQTGISQGKLKYRLSEGYTLEQAIAMGTQPHAGKKYQWNGRLLSLAEICRETGIPRQRVFERLHRGWDLERAVFMPLNSTAGATISAQRESILDGIEAILQDMPEAESTRCRAAISIFENIMGGDPRESNFRCTIPMTEYTFEGGLIRYCIRFENGNTARLTAWYKNHGFASDLNRIYRINGGCAREIHAD